MSISNAASKIVVVVGAGPGTGFAFAKRFALAGHPVALLSRQQARLESLATDINALQKGPAKAFAADATQAASLASAFSALSTAFGPEARVWGAVFNSGSFTFAPFIDTTEEQLDRMLDTTVKGGLLFAQAYLRALTSHSDWEGAQGQHSSEPNGFLAITGATASVKGSANFAAFGASKAALRSLAQSLAREWQPKGVHVFHTIVDGLIDTERVRGMMGKDFEPDARFNTDDIAETYYHVATQRKSTWTFELDMRPFKEKF